MFPTGKIHALETVWLLNSGCFPKRNWEKSLLKISQQTFAKKKADEHGLEFGVFRFLLARKRLAEFDGNEAPGKWPFRELVGSPMRLSNQTRPDISNAVRTVARYSAAPKRIHRRAALAILGYVRRTSSFGITFQRG